MNVDKNNKIFGHKKVLLCSIRCLEKKDLFYYYLTLKYMKKACFHHDKFIKKIADIIKQCKFYYKMFQNQYYKSNF